MSAQTRTLDDYRAAGEALEANASAAEGYEKLMTVSDQYDSEEYSNASMAEALLEISKDTLGEKGQALYDELAANVFPGACESYLASGTEALEAADYETAIGDLGKVVRMDAGYNEGQALYELARAYWNNGDSENASKYFQQVVDGYGDSEYAEDAQQSLDEIAGSQAQDGEEGNSTAEE